MLNKKTALVLNIRLLQICSDSFTDFQDYTFKVAVTIKEHKIFSFVLVKTGSFNQCFGGITGISVFHEAFIF